MVGGTGGPMMMRRSADAESLPFVVKKRNCCAQFARKKDLLIPAARPATTLLLPYMIRARPRLTRCSLLPPIYYYSEATTWVPLARSSELSQQSARSQQVFFAFLLRNQFLPPFLFFFYSNCPTCRSPQQSPPPADGGTGSQGRGCLPDSPMVPMCCDNVIVVRDEHNKGFLVVGGGAAKGRSW